MKKLVLKKSALLTNKTDKGYRINYREELNEAQYEAVMHDKGPALVIAGAGTGKTRTLVYRLARLIEDGVQAESILLLTFTRKAASEMLKRAGAMLDARCDKVSGGTFHAFAVNILRRYADLIGYSKAFTILDQSDVEETINLLRTQNKFDRSSRRFPRKETLAKIFNLAVNKLTPVSDIVFKEFPQYKEESDSIDQLFKLFRDYKKKYSLMDYDDMLLNLYYLLKEHPKAQKEISARYSYIMVDEYQDTNKLQHEIALNLTDNNKNIMAVGDDAQSIYSFRGAEFKNIIEFPNSFDDCKIFKIEENYRSSQKILDLTNAVIAESPFQYQKNLYSNRSLDNAPFLISALNERQQSEFVVQQILELREEGISLDDMAVLVRSGYLSFDLELELSKANIPFVKFGGLKFVESAHIKDMLAFFKIMANNRDAVNWHRILTLLDGVGPRTAEKVIVKLISSNYNFSEKLELNFTGKSATSLNSLFDFLSELFANKSSISEKAELIAAFLNPIMKDKYDDWNRRSKDVEMFVQISDKYASLNDMLAEMALDAPVESAIDVEEEDKDDERFTISTIHSAKGLEWKAVFIIWTLDGKFPSAKAIDSIDSVEEERRLFYVACTRAKDYLYLVYPINIYDRESGSVLSLPSRFLNSIDENIAETYYLSSEN
jgi:DNA helicase-2/ATP-dependent DNA helicase PcrA